MKVLISGATGTTGSEVARQLRADGVQVRAMTRSATSAAGLRDADVDALVADPAGLAAALDGVDAVYVATNSSPQLPDLEANLARAATQAGIGHVVKLPVIGAEPNAPLTFARLHHESEDQIKSSGVRWTMVRPNGFMQNTLAWAPQIAGGTVYGPVMDARWSIVDVRDVAAAAVAALRDPDAHAGQTYTATGPGPPPRASRSRPSPSCWADRSISPKTTAASKPMKDRNAKVAATPGEPEKISDQRAG